MIYYAYAVLIFHVLILGMTLSDPTPRGVKGFHAMTAYSLLVLPLAGRAIGWW